MTDGQGKTIECRSAIFIMTSNLASEEIGHHGAKLREEAEKIQKGKMAGSVGKTQFLVSSNLFDSNSNAK